MTTLPCFIAIGFFFVKTIYLSILHAIFAQPVFSVARVYISTHYFTCHLKRGIISIV